jgi:hypothetical protein
MRKLVLVLAVVLSFVLGALVVRAASGTPEVNTANATMSLKSATPFHSIGCVGEDQTDYVTWRGMWTGTQTEVSVGESDYILSGSLSVSGIVWTINSNNSRGVLTAKVVLTDNAGAVEYVGRLTLVTQGKPAAGVVVLGRGFIVARFSPPDETVTPGDDNLVANVEMKINGGTFGATGVFGDTSGGLLDYSAVTNVAPGALDGTC